MRNILICMVISMLILVGCTGGFGNRCVDDNVCSLDEEVAGSCADCSPDFAVQDLQMSIGDNRQYVYMQEGEIRSFSFDDINYEIQPAVISWDLGTPVVTLMVNGETQSLIQQGETRYFNGDRLKVDVTYIDAPYEQPVPASTIADTLREGETKTYAIEGVEYEITADYVSDPGVGAETRLVVNGEVTDLLYIGSSDILSGGLRIVVRDILVNEREGVVSFYVQKTFADTVPEGESRNYYADGQFRHTVTVLFVSDSGEPEVKFMLDNEITQSLRVGEYDTVSGGAQIYVRDIQTNGTQGVVSYYVMEYLDDSPYARRGSVELSLSSKGGKRVVYYSYCVKNTGSSFEGSVPVYETVSGDMESRPEELERYLSFQKPILVGNFQVYRTSDGILRHELTTTDEFDTGISCFGGSREMDVSRNYQLIVGINGPQQIRERSYENNQQYTSMTGEPISFPDKIVEYDIGDYRYQYTAYSSNYYVFPSGATYYGASYLNARTDFGQYVGIFAPRMPSESDEVFQSWTQGMTRVESALGPLYVYEYIGEGQAYRSVYLQGQNGEIVVISLLHPSSEPFDATADPLVAEYQRRYGAPVAIP